jgi:hypothetical protein
MQGSNKTWASFSDQLQRGWFMLQLWCMPAHACTHGFRILIFFLRSLILTRVSGWNVEFVLIWWIRLTSYNNGLARVFRCRVGAISRGSERCTWAQVSMWEERTLWAGPLSFVHRLSSCFATSRHSWITSECDYGWLGLPMHIWSLITWEEIGIAINPLHYRRIWDETFEMGCQPSNLQYCDCRCRCLSWHQKYIYLGLPRKRPPRPYIYIIMAPKLYKYRAPFIFLGLPPNYYYPIIMRL